MKLYSQTVSPDYTSVAMKPLSPTNKTTSVADMDSESGSQSLLTAMKTFVNSVERMDKVVLVPTRLIDVHSGDLAITQEQSELNGNDEGQTKSEMPTALESQNIDLRSCFLMLNAVKSELVRGTPDDTYHSSNDENVQKVAANFRSQLRGLQATLQQLSECANFLSRTYEKNLEDNQDTINWPGVMSPGL